MLGCMNRSIIHRHTKQHLTPYRHQSQEEDSAQSWQLQHAVDQETALLNIVGAVTGYIYSASNHEERLKELREGKGTASAEANYTEPLLGKVEGFVLGSFFSLLPCIRDELWTPGDPVSSIYFPLF